MASDISHLLPPFCCLSLCSSQTLRCKDKQFVSLSGEGSYRCFVDRNKHGWSICCLSLLVQASYSSSLSTPPPILSSNHSSREQWQSAAFTHSFTSPVIVRKHSTNTLAELSKLQIYLRCCSTHTHTHNNKMPLQILQGWKWTFCHPVHADPCGTPELQDLLMRFTLEPNDDWWVWISS